MYNVGALVASWATYGTLTIASNWTSRAPSMLQAFPLDTQLCFP